MDYALENNASELSSSNGVNEEVAKSKLDASVQILLKLICDIKAMEQTVIEMEYDAEKAPLGIYVYLNLLVQDF